MEPSALSDRERRGSSRVVSRINTKPKTDLGPIRGRTRVRHDSNPWTSGHGCGYTIGMKTAVSLPDRVYREAEGYAKRTRKSRSQLYAEALAEYLARHAPDEVTEAMNIVIDELGDAAPDSFVQRAGRRMLRCVEW